MRQLGEGVKRAVSFGLATMLISFASMNVYFVFYLALTKPLLALLVATLPLSIFALSTSQSKQLAYLRHRIFATIDHFARSFSYIHRAALQLDKTRGWYISHEV